MLEPRTACYPWGLRVTGWIDLLNDGSHPGGGAGDVLVPIGRTGEIVNIGHHTGSNQPVYLVDFEGVLVGVTEDEIEPAVEHRSPPAVD